MNNVYSSQMLPRKTLSYLFKGVGRDAYSDPSSIDLELQTSLNGE